MMDPVWHGKIVRNGDHNFFDVNDFDKFVMYLGRFEADTAIEVIVRKLRKKATGKQNRYYWGVIIKIIADFTGHSPDEIHTTLGAKFLKRQSDIGMEYVPSTTSLSTVEREKYHEECRRWAQIVLSLHVPLPNQVDIGDDDYGKQKESDIESNDD